MSSRRTTLVAVIATLALAAPAASANAAPPTVDPTVCRLFGLSLSPFGPTSLFGGAGLADVLNKARASVNCPAPAPTPGLPGWQFPWSP